MSEYDYPHGSLATTIHLPERDWEIEGHVYLGRGDEFRDDNGTTYTVERVLFIGQKNSRVGERGERTIERLLSASVTCRLQERSLFAYLTDVLTASIRGDPIPALA